MTNHTFNMMTDLFLPSGVKMSKKRHISFLIMDYMSPELYQNLHQEVTVGPCDMQRSVKSHHYFS
jgi:hypothetical protein